MITLVTGSTGFLGPYLTSSFSSIPNNSVVGISRSKGSDMQYDLADENAVKHLFSRISPDIIVHAAAMTNVEECQAKPKQAFAINTTAIRHIVTHMPGDCRLINISTDMVYSGPGPHSEDSHTENPMNVYALTKYLGEHEASKAHRHLNIRTNMYGVSKGPKRSSSIVEFFMDGFKNGREMKLFYDILFSPMHASTLSSILVQIIKGPFPNHLNGTYNLAPNGPGASKSKFALMLAKLLDLPTDRAVPSSSLELAYRVVRPSDTRLSNLKFKKKFPHIQIPTLEEDLINMCMVLKCAN